MISLLTVTVPCILIGYFASYEVFWLGIKHCKGLLTPFEQFKTI